MQRPSGRQITPTLVLLLLWAGPTAAIALAAIDLGWPAKAQIILLSLILCTAGILSAVIMSRPSGLRQSLLRAKLGPWAGVGFSIVFGAASLIWLGTAKGQSEIIDRHYLIRAGVLSLEGFLSLVLGYLVSSRVVRQRPEIGDRVLYRRYNRAPSFVAVGALWLGGVLGAAIAISSGRFGYLSDPSQATSSSQAQIIYLISQLGILATVLAAWRHADQGLFLTRLVLWLVLSSQVLLGLFSGQKEEVIVQLIAVLVGFGSRRRIYFTPVVISIVVVIFFVMPFVTQYRAEVSVDSTRLSPDQVLHSVSFGNIAKSSIGSSAAGSLTSTVSRLSRLGDVTIILQKTPGSVPFVSPRELFESPILGLIPRSIWPGKPVLNAGYVMSSTYYELPATVYTSTPPTPYGDLWRHGGLPYVIIGMFLMGSVGRFVDMRRGDPSTDPTILFLPMLLLPAFAKQEIDFVGFVASLVGLVLLAALASRVVSALSGRPLRQPSGLKG